MPHKHPRRRKTSRRRVSGGTIYDDLIKQRRMEIELLERQRTTRNKIRSLERQIRSKRIGSRSPQKSPQYKKSK